MTELRTGRLRLRPPEPADLDAFAEIYADDEVVRHLGGFVRSRDDVRRGLDAQKAHWDRYGVGQFALVRAEDGDVLGRVGFLVWDPETWTNGLWADLPEPYETEIGWVVARQHWGNGYATEAALAARDWIVRERGAERLISLINVENHASARVAEKLGFVPGRVVDGEPFSGPTCVYESAPR
jgi:RimJ/RimL family protein N-acetyltransferase